MRQLLESQQEVRDPQEFIQNLKVELYPEEVYTFTPKGLVKALPRGATPIDFAYSIHTDVGHQCVGARVNGKMVPLRTRLKNGDIVEIVTQAGHKPSRDWLNFVVDLARAQQDQAPDSRARRRRARDRARPQGVREGSAALRSESEDARRRRGVRQGARRFRRAEGRRSVRGDRLRQDRAEAGARASSCRPTRCARSRREGAVAVRRSGACSAPAKRRSRSAASTT